MLRKLNSGFYKQLVKITPDRTTAGANDIINLRFPVSSVLNMQSLNLHFKGTTTGTQATFFPKYTSTLIKRLSVSVNGVSVQVINDYNIIYNIFANHNSFNNTTALGQNVEPSVKWTEAVANGAQEGAITGENKILNTATSIVNERLCINHFLGILSGGSTPVWNTDALGEVVVSIQLDNAGVLMGGAEATALAYTDSTYSLSDIFATVEAYSFSSDEYYNLLADSDKKIGFNDFIVSRFASVEKKTGINVSTYLNASSLDYVIGTAVSDNGSTSTTRRMIAYSSQSTGATQATAGPAVATSALNTYLYLSNPAIYTNDGGGLGIGNVGDGFFQCENMRFPLQYIESSSFSINNRQINFGPLDPLLIFQQNLLSLGYENLDVSANGFNSGIVSILHYFKYYGCCIQSFECINPDVFYISGLNTQGASVAINWTAGFGTTSTFRVNPILIAKTSRIMQVMAGRQISVL